MKPAHRTKPKYQLLAIVHAWTKALQENNYEQLEIDYEIRRVRIRSREYCNDNTHKDPGQDGYRWECTCGGEFEKHCCDHLIKFVHGGFKRKADEDGFRITWFEPTELGSKVLAHKWVERLLSS